MSQRKKDEFKSNCLANKTIMVTGASGFLGKKLVGMLLSRGARVIAVSTKDRTTIACGLGHSYSPDTLRVVPVNDPESIRGSMDGTDVLVNCAYPRNASGEDAARGLKFIADVFSWSNDHKVGNIVNISSQSVYAKNRPCPASEETPVSLESSYAIGKYATELMLSGICKASNTTNIRLASLIGPEFNQRLINKMAESANKEGIITVVNGLSRFGFLDVVDAAKALLTLVESEDEAWRPIYNVGAQAQYTPYELACVVRDCFEFLGVTVAVRREGVERETVCSSMDSSLFEEDFGWRPKTSIQESVAAIVRDIVHPSGDGDRWEGQ